MSPRVLGPPCAPGVRLALFGGFCGQWLILHCLLPGCVCVCVCVFFFPLTQVDADSAAVVVVCGRVLGKVARGCSLNLVQQTEGAVFFDDY